MYSFVFIGVMACNKDNNTAKIAGALENIDNMGEQNKPGNIELPSSNEELAKLIAFEKGDYKYSVEDFFKNPERSYFQMSPDGLYYAYFAPYKRRKNLFIQKINEKESTQITFATDRDIAGYAWANDNRLIYIKDDGGDENYKLYAVNKDGSNPKDLTPYEKVKIDLIDALQDQDDYVLIGMNKDDQRLFSPYRLNIVTGDLEQLAKNDNPLEPIAGWMTDHDGQLRLCYKVVDGVKVQLLYRLDEKEDWQIALTTNWKESVTPLFFDFKQKDVVYATSNMGRDKAAIVQLDLKSGEVIETLFEHNLVDVDGLSYSKKRKVLTTISYTTDKRQFEFLDRKVDALYQDLHAKLPGYEVVISSTNKAEDKCIVRTYSDRSLGAYYYYDIDLKAIKKICDVSPWIDENDMADMRPVQYKSRDGLIIHGYLTLPKRANRNLPLIVLPHGGPSARDSWGYRPDVQLLANRGYAVLQMNFRGSTGYGKKFWTSGFRKWGEEMQHDITDGVHWLVEEGIADADKVAIYGGSYGGYATLAGLTFTPDVYACGVDYVGVSSIFTILENIPPYWEPYREMLYEQIGDPNNEQDSLRMSKYSPALHAENIKAPLLVVQGANDPRVKILESDQMVEALRNSGVEVPYMVKYDEGHGFRNEENQFEFYKVMLGFMAKHLKQDALMN